MNRRKALKTMVAGGLGLVAGAEVVKGEEVPALIDGDIMEDPCLQGDERYYSYKKTLTLSDGDWLLYSRKKWRQPLILDRNTFLPYKPLEPIVVEENIGMHLNKFNNDCAALSWLFTRFADVVMPNQRVLCRNVEDPSEEKYITT
jgi:hypothetical protein